MAKALDEAHIRPDLVFGTSIGAVNGAVLASGELHDCVRRLERGWHGLASTALTKLQEVLAGERRRGSAAAAPAARTASATAGA